MKVQTRQVGVQVIVALAFLWLHPFASWPQTAAAAQIDSASIQSISNWKTMKRGKHVTIRVNPGANVSLYGTITVGTVAYSGPAKKLKPQESDRLVSVLHDALSRDLSGAALSTSGSAARVLVLNADITKVRKTHPWLNVVTMAAVFVPLDFGGANATAWIVDQQTSEVVAEIETEGCGQIYEVFASLQPLGHSKLALKKDCTSPKLRPLMLSFRVIANARDPQSCLVWRKRS